MQNIDDVDYRPYGIAVTDGFLLRRSPFGQTLILDEDRIEQCRGWMLAHGITRLEVNYALGFSGHDVRCLKDFGFVDGFEIIHRTLDDLSPVHCLTQVTNLLIQTHCTTEIDFGRFPRLTDCRIYWRKGARSIFECRQLRRLFLDYYKTDNIEGVRELGGLRTLILGNSPVADLRPIEALGMLKELSLINLRRITDISVLTHVPQLERLEIAGCRGISNYGVIAHVRRLKSLIMTDVGNLTSIQFVKELRQLEDFAADGDTRVVDGRLDALLELPQLSWVTVARRKDYAPAVERIERSVVDRLGQMAQPHLIHI